MQNRATEAGRMHHAGKKTERRADRGRDGAEDAQAGDGEVAEDAAMSDEVKEDKVAEYGWTGDGDKESLECWMMK